MDELGEPLWPALLERVCDGRELEVAFQPIVDLARGIVCGYEGLARFHSGGPQEWFGAAAWYGYAPRLEALALAAILRRREELPDDCFLSVNLSPLGLLCPEVRDLLRDGVDLQGLVIEVTEQAPVEDYQELGRELDRLRVHGAVIAVDDVGAGYAGLRHLIALRPQFVKLDRALVAGVDADGHQAAAVSAIGALAGELDAWLIAEGVERVEELSELCDLEVPLAQGFLLGRPRDVMFGMDWRAKNLLRARRRDKGGLGELARPAPAVRVRPEIVAEPTVLVDEHRRPREVIVPAGGRRVAQHPAMCVQGEEDLREVALRAVARPSADRVGPLCLCDELGRFSGLIGVERMLEALAREPRAGERRREPRSR